MTTKLAFSRKEVCQTLSIGTTKLHELINDGKLETFKIGRKTLVKAESVRRLVDEAAWAVAQNRNAPGRKAEGVECLLGGDIDASITIRAQVQHLVSPGFPFTRASVLAPIAFGGGPTPEPSGHWVIDAIWSFDVLRPDETPWNL